MFVPSLISFALGATSHIYCVSATEETVLGNDLFESLAYLKRAAEQSTAFFFFPNHEWLLLLLQCLWALSHTFSHTPPHANTCTKH